MTQPHVFSRRHADEYPENEDGVTCLHCRATDLYWQDTYTADGQRRPKLYENGKPHVCKPNADDFEDLTDAAGVALPPTPEPGPGPGPHIVPTALPMFAVAVARRKWESLQQEGYRMQRIEFAMSKDGLEKRGSIDPWGKVLWHSDGVTASDHQTFSQTDADGRKP